MYPLHTGSILLDIAHAQRNEVIADSDSRRRATQALRRTATTPQTRPPKRPWWWRLVSRAHRAA